MRTRANRDKNLVKISKFLSLVLRHKPEHFGVSLDHNGWINVDALLAAANRVGVTLNKVLLQRVVKESDKQRFALSDDGLRIRANYGQSVAVDLGLEAVTPPEILFHGTATRFFESIKKEGLSPARRQYVHLSPDKHMAMSVGKRHGKPLVLTVEALRMHEGGFKFFRSHSGIWLTERVPAHFISFFLPDRTD
jgi:putative RNA 2'-phosphotransferase